MNVENDIISFLIYMFVCCCSTVLLAPYFKLNVKEGKMLPMQLTCMLVKQIIVMSIQLVADNI